MLMLSIKLMLSLKLILALMLRVPRKFILSVMLMLSRKLMFSIMLMLSIMMMLSIMLLSIMFDFSVKKFPMIVIVNECTNKNTCNICLQSWLCFPPKALQSRRGKPYNAANCAIGKLRKPLPPFSLGPDVNPDPVTREHSVANTVSTCLILLCLFLTTLK